MLAMKLCSEMKGYYWYLDKTRIVDSTKHSKQDKKLSRKKERPFKTVNVNGSSLVLAGHSCDEHQVSVTTKKTSPFRWYSIAYLGWGIILGSRTDLHVQIGSMTGEFYRDVIMEEHVRLLRRSMGVEFVFMDDNADSHRENIVSECLQLQNFTRMDWSAFSPDLNLVMCGNVDDLRTLFNA
ncbi:transposable element Tc3 transposase [Trichonephila clavipes]|uniref:Transposable element Tc3 transposase n=1 Tax=Trichonephila clavipes TaxID=2585209 RepID=A0A8X6WEI4_TRICX|nr:transposable element Tc3 transposase [Trichonephila clavipes]